jgi:plastocyanin domain-containing protein
MINKVIISGIASLGLIFGLVSDRAVAQIPHEMNEMQPTEQTGFRRIEQPLANKIAVTLGGLGLIGLELWWFLLSKPRSKQAVAAGGVQEITVTVDGGYEPSQIVVQAGQPVRLNFDRKDPSSCLEEVRFPDFHIAQELPLNQVTPIELTPEKPGRYEFTCGMNMFRGMVEVQPADGNTAVASIPIPQPIHHPTPKAHHADHFTNPSIAVLFDL